MKSLTPLRRHSIRRPLIGLSAERGTLRRRPKFILTAWGLVRVSLFDENVSLVMERAAIIGRDEIATPSIMAALAEGFPHDARPLTSHEDAHALPSFPFFPSDLRCPGAASAERSVTVRCKHPLAIG